MRGCTWERDVIKNRDQPPLLLASDGAVKGHGVAETDLNVPCP